MAIQLTETSFGPARSPAANSAKGTCAAGKSTSKLSGMRMLYPLTATDPPELTSVPMTVTL